MAETGVHLIMLIVSGHGEDSQWFDYVPAFHVPPVRIEWDLGTMSVELPEDAANALISRGYARLMTEAEIKEYTAPPLQAEENWPTSKRGEQA